MLAPTTFTTAAGPDAGAPRPNIVIILADDMGWGDAGFNGCREIPTPNLDALAASGIRFSAGYAAHPYCSPSRAAILTGRHPQRFGHECNPEPGDLAGTPLEERLLSDLLKAAGYRTSIIGKWHLGDDARFWPTQRGFDEWFGFTGGVRSFWGDEPVQGSHEVLRRNGVAVPVSGLGHLTDEFTDEAIAFIERNRRRPFFLFLSHLAPHWPDHATSAHLARTEHIEYGGRAVYGAMVAAMDEGIGRVLRKLDELALRRNTLIVFCSDNGGRAEHAMNFPYRGHKGMLFEGGIRVPFCLSWPSRLPAGRVFDQPVTGLDLFPTALAAAGVSKPEDLVLDGLSLLPYLADPQSALPERMLFWRYATASSEFGYAVRDGEWKLISSRFKERKLLFNLVDDPFEQHDRVGEHPEVADRLARRFEAWATDKVPPRWLDPHGWHVRRQSKERQDIIDSARQGESRKGVNAQP